MSARRRAAVGAATCALVLASVGLPAAAQPAARDTVGREGDARDATALEEAAIAAWVSYRAVRARWGEAHETTLARAAEARAAADALEAVLSRGARVDTAALALRLEAELDDVVTRLGELGTRCGGPAVEVLAAEARRDALSEAIGRLTSDGPFVPRG